VSSTSGQIHCRIYQPPKSAMQSGRAVTSVWTLEYEVETARRPEPLNKAPAAVYVITAEDIRRSGTGSLPEVLRDFAAGRSTLTEHLMFECTIRRGEEIRGGERSIQAYLKCANLLAHGA